MLRDEFRFLKRESLVGQKNLSSEGTTFKEFGKTIPYESNFMLLQGILRKIVTDSRLDVKKNMHPSDSKLRYFPFRFIAVFNLKKGKMVHST